MGKVITVALRVSDEERRLIEKHAKAEKKTISRYLRGCYLADMIMGGDLQAAKIVWNELGHLARDKFFEKMVPPDNVVSYLEGKGW